MARPALLLSTLLALALPFAGSAAADSECGVLGIGASYTCGGDSSDGRYAGCDGVWRDAGSGTAGTYAQVCVDDMPHAWVCPAFTHDWSVRNPHCIATDHPFGAVGAIQLTVEDAAGTAVPLAFDTVDIVLAVVGDALA